MNKECFSIISTVSIKHKILSCVLAFFVLISSLNLLNFEGHKKTIAKSVEVSTKIVLNQFFNISAFSANAISKLFSGTKKNTVAKISNMVQPAKETITAKQQQTEKTNITVATAKETENNKGRDTKDNNAIKASVGYSIVFGTFAINKVIKSEWLKDLDVSDKLLETNFVKYIENVSLVSGRKVINVMYIMMLLLAILLARRNVGDNNIINNNINNIKNKKITRFI